MAGKGVFMGITVYSDISVKEGAGDTDGNPSVELSFADVSAEVYNTASLTEQNCICIN